ncbi:hypothetical protein [Streptomonospora wellingtoniae]|uniref:Uncharacterized protein n=1 Tax=Streptomonospora wellingtoniae TaxID=3075544 RepID=A0ABU2KVZ9_9ACTN|nr:hypothetical protein [Streptomonospora sp. DSM 45055]MDT0303467.1 hypothetical protein [Streptomonospora sp. DSM 45055]
MVDATGNKAFRPGRTPGDSRFRRWFAGPPGWIVGGAAAANALVSLWTYSAPGGYFQPLLATASVWVLLLLAVGIKAVMQPVFGVRHGRPPWQDWARWGTVLGIMAATVALTQSGACMRAGTAWAQPAVAAYASDPAASEAPDRFGPYSVQQAGDLGDRKGARFLVEGAGFLNERGFAYSPDGPPTAGEEDSYEHLSGPWYTWTRNV